MSQQMKKILCIEDNREFAALIGEELLERGYDVSFAFEGHQGFASILKSPPDLVLCDVTMPKISGFEVLRRLTSLCPRFENIPFIFLTALSDRENEIKARKLGADDYVTKPVDFEILDMIIKARLTKVARSGVWPQAIQLSDREIEVLTWTARGKTSVEIAGILNLSKRTIDFHVNNARGKLNATTRIEAVIKAATGHLIDPYSTTA